MSFATLIIVIALASARKREYGNRNKVMVLDYINDAEGPGSNASGLISETEALPPALPLDLSTPTVGRAMQHDVSINVDDSSEVMLATPGNNGTDHGAQNGIIHACPVCGSPHIVKKGRNRRGHQRYHCKDCGAYRTIKPSDAAVQKELS